jgi:hypothetical protein
METGEGERSFLKDSGDRKRRRKRAWRTYFHQCVRAVCKVAMEGEIPIVVKAFKKVSRKSNLRESRCIVNDAKAGRIGNNKDI